ncbi:MAG TPA: penicillin-insensitive murein endopeptidase [Polyangiaceae bacterium]|nr:MAG: penicillin-insensitive murein endopeptidase [Deltaproteobacteria bacterium ADurb.Bin207]HNZ25314.1 penicillin-insensitive murein endopeptidase [Polyangiaceae bacterium]HOD25662.1 penicillin-insensitive murein endopeptidase [Polyangiaceae bacterium]HOE50399.1 penicillin-insensitive murein endopeptidase [Polyangiaceae bacterium]HOH03392.1 penicillin-insensitive murein endopeptidase [Polyangiaceae bacterium]
MAFDPARFPVWLLFSLLGCVTPGLSRGPETSGAKSTAPVSSSSGPQPPRTEAAGPWESEALEDDDDDPILDDGGGDDDEASDDSKDSVAAYRPVDHPLASISDAELERMVQTDLASLGPMSLGATNAGRLINAVQMPKGERWELIDPARAWGTQETVDGIIRCIDEVHARFPDSPKMQIGHISARQGGALSPHVSHQAGRDVDLSYYYTSPTRWFTRAHAGNLDRARTWAFVRALIVHTDVEMILIDGGLQRLLREHALAIGEDPAWINDIFRGSQGRPALIRHARGHANHLHVRFYSPVARETARRVQPLLAKTREMDPPVAYVMHRARKGDTLGRLANHYGTTVEAIQRANGLRSTAIRAKRTYRIPTRGRVVPVVPQPISVPPRRLPPEKQALRTTGDNP